MRALLHRLRLRWHDCRVEIADMDYQWAAQHAPEMASRKLDALFRAKRARILAAGTRLPRISMDALIVATCVAGALPLLLIDIARKFA